MIEKFIKPAAITTNVNIRPGKVTGDISPYPTVVNVTTVHQRELNNELNLFSPSSAKIYSNRYIPNVEVNKNEEYAGEASAVSAKPVSSASPDEPDSGADGEAGQQIG